jgi:hypothetical protein
MVIPRRARYRGRDKRGNGDMRKFAILALCFGAAACGGSEEKKAQGPPAQLPAGTWQVASEVTAFRSTDRTTPAVPSKVGDKENATVCVDKAGPQPPAALFAGSGYDCAYKSAYIKEGVLNAALECHRKDVPGMMMISVQGNYTATGFTGTSDTTAFISPGGYQVGRKLTGTVKPGACTPAPAGGGDDDGDDDD